MENLLKAKAKHRKPILYLKGGFLLFNNRGTHLYPSHLSAHKDALKHGFLFVVV